MELLSNPDLTIHHSKQQEHNCLFLHNFIKKYYRQNHQKICAHTHSSIQPCKQLPVYRQTTDFTLKTKQLTGNQPGKDQTIDWSISETIKLFASAFDWLRVKNDLMIQNTPPPPPHTHTKSTKIDHQVFSMSRHQTYRLTVHIQIIVFIHILTDETIMLS